MCGEAAGARRGRLEAGGWGRRRAAGGGGLPRRGVGAPRGDWAESAGAPGGGLWGCGVEVGGSLSGILEKGLVRGSSFGARP